MTADSRSSRPRGFGLFARIVYVHQAILLALFVAKVRDDYARVVQELPLQHVSGIVLSIGVIVAMFCVATRKSLKALSWLRLILWLSVIKVLMVEFWLVAQGQIEWATALRPIVFKESVAIPLAIYWSRSVHIRYLNTFKHC